MKRYCLPFLITLILLASNCVFVDKSIILPNPTGNIYTMEDVQVFYLADSLPDYQRLAYLRARGHDYANKTTMINKLRKLAGKLGANAIIMERMYSPNFATRVMLHIADLDSEKHFEAIAIYAPSLDSLKQSALPL